MKPKGTFLFRVEVPDQHSSGGRAIALPQVIIVDKEERTVHVCEVRRSEAIFSRMVILQQGSSRCSAVALPQLVYWLPRNEVSHGKNKEISRVIIRDGPVRLGQKGRGGVR